ncbi:nucleotidyltransferase [Geotalea daltonii FRC-32]|uniref:Nucleotidyltransferase n=1 Tax=Geotalea daltonii (strain DSM 22248 / JCM 15807 / FRC-32) TaxID=316067 RepID=B9M248_GEODF|nr:nucleotidyltransferase domain-containing protein [Geotalea daltonii]ACM21166.1 nucleotidyltransferase [Geotalea daltonii FRC-32]
MILRDDALAVLSRLKQELLDCYGITELGIFGSVAREQTTGTSDVDVVVKMKDPNLYTLVHVKETLEEALHEHVDVVHYRDRMNAFLKSRIDREAIYV